MRVSVVICTYNRAAALEQTLLALDYLRYEDFEVVVVNGPSTDDTEAVLRKYTGRIKPLVCGHANLSIARNIGIAHSAGDIVAFLDDDAIAEPDWLDMLVSGYDAPRVAGVGGYIKDHTGVSFQARVVACDRFGDSKYFKNLAEADISHEPGCDRYLSLTGCNSSFRRAALLEIGGFDEEYAYFLDETDVCLKLVDAGHDLTVVSSAQVHHRYLKSHLRDERKVPHSLFVPCRSKAYFCAKFMGDIDHEAVLRNLRTYELQLGRDLRWSREASLISTQKYDQLLSEISAGIGEGLRDFETYRPGRHLLSRHWPETQPEFLRFHAKMPAEKRLKLCFVSREYKPGAVGGIGVWTTLAAEGLAARGHQVTVVSAGTRPHSTVDFQDGVWVHRVALHHDRRRKSPVLPDLPGTVMDRCYAVYDEAQRIFSGRGIDVLSFPIWDLEGLACTSAKDYAVAVSLHTTYGLSLAHKPHWQNDENYRRQFVERMMDAERALLSSDIPLLANSRAIVRDITKQYGIQLDEKRTTHIPHGVPDRLTTRPRLNSKEDLGILFVGRFETRKGIDLLLRIIPKLLVEFPRVKFTLAGNDGVDDGGTRHKEAFLRAHSNCSWIDRVEFCGELDDAELDDAYRAADVFVAPSRYESFGLIFIEAAQFALPIVAPNVGGVPEIIQDGVNGLLFEAGNAEHLEAALRRILNDGVLRTKLGAAARQTFLCEYTFASMVDRLEDFYRSVAAEWLDHAVPNNAFPEQTSYTRDPAGS